MGTFQKIDLGVPIILCSLFYVCSYMYLNKTFSRTGFALTLSCLILPHTILISMAFSASALHCCFCASCYLSIYFQQYFKLVYLSPAFYLVSKKLSFTLWLVLDTLFIGIHWVEINNWHFYFLRICISIFTMLF